MFYHSLILLIGMTFSINSFAQDAFILPADEQTPSEQKQEKDVLSAKQNFSAQDEKKNVYDDLNYYFQKHEWVAIGISFAGYFDEQTQLTSSYKKIEIDKRGNELLASLPANSYRDSYIRITVPTMRLHIKQVALVPLYTNKSITAIHINRYGNFDL